MRTPFFVLLCFLVSVISVSAEDQIDLTQKISKESYSLGVSIGRTFKNQSMELDYDALFKGIKDAKSGGEILMSDQEITDTLKNVQRELTEKRESEKKELADTNKKKGDEFLKENGKVAVDCVNNATFDLVITDLIMPEKEGLETIADIRRSFAEIPIIAISGGGRLGPNDYLETARFIGANATLAKPFARTELIKTVDSLLG